MPVSMASQHDPFRGVGPPPSPARAKLRVPQARVLAALMPGPDDHPVDWPLITRANLAVRAGYTAVSGTTNRALMGISASGSRKTGDPHPGLLDLKLVVEVKIDLDGKTEINYRITPAGVEAYRAFVAAGNSIPPVKDASICTNDRYVAK